MNGTELHRILDCPVYGENSDYYIAQVNFWVEGVIQTALAIPGLIGNFVFGLVLTRKELRNSFNLLLVALSFFDSCYIIGAVLESIRTSFDMATDVHLILFPYLLYPGQQTAMTISIFLIVAIAFERYVAVHNPLDYKQAMNDSDAIRRRLLKYLLPVILAAIIFNIPKFFESTFVYITQEVDGKNVTVVSLNVTELRIDKTYSAYVNWSQSIMLGFLPAILLMYFNTKIYLDIRYQTEFFSNCPMEGTANNFHGSRKCEEIGQTLFNIFSKVGQYTTGDTLIVAEERSANLRPSTPVGGTSRSSTANTPREQNGYSSSKSSNARRRKAEDKMAMIFVAIVTGFLLTNFLRIFLNFHEVLVLETAMACSAAGFRSFPVWALISGSISHFLMVFNSSINILFYCVFNSQFRAEVKKVLAEKAHILPSVRLFSKEEARGSRLNPEGNRCNQKGKQEVKAIINSSKSSTLENSRCSPEKPAKMNETIQQPLLPDVEVSHDDLTQDSEFSRVEEESSLTEIRHLKTVSETTL